MVPGRQGVCRVAKEPLLIPPEDRDPRTARTRPIFLNAFLVYSNAHDLYALSLLVVDISSSMAEEAKLVAAKRALVQFLDNVVGSNDKVGLVTFSSKVEVAVALNPLSLSGPQLRAAIMSLSPSGDTRLLDAVLLATQEFELQSAEELHSIILLTDGEENKSNATLDDALGALHRQTDLIAYGVAYAGAGRSLLERIASSTGGVVLESQPDSVSQVYETLSRRF